MNVYILATCRKLELLRATTLVFDTLRLGFPTAKITVFCNDLQGEALKQVKALSKRVEATTYKTSTIHHKWVEELVQTQQEPFTIVDTDMVFWDQVEQWKFAEPLAGRLIPQFFDTFTHCVTRPRLHTSLLFIDPVKARTAIADYFAQFPQTVFNPPANLYYPIFFPGMLPDGHQVNLFHDTACLLYHAIGGQPFEEWQLDCYDHLHCGTISDIVSPRMPEARLREAHFAIFENPQLARGIWRQQELYYQKFAE